MSRNILFLAAHTDDEITSLATLIKLAQSGHQIHYIAFSHCGNARLMKECKKAVSTFATTTTILYLKHRTLRSQRQYILDYMVQLNKKYNPHIVFCPNSHAGHQDHEAIHNEACRAFKSTTIYGWEMIWNSTHQHLQIGSEIKDEHLQQKIETLAHYKTQAHRPYFNPEFLRSLAIVRGMQFKLPLAEAFEAIRIRI